MPPEHPSDSKSVHPIVYELLKRTKDAVEQALREGYIPPSGRTGRARKGAIAVAAQRLGESTRTVERRVLPGGACERAGLAVDWNLYTFEAEMERRAALRGEHGFAPILPGFEIKQTTTVRDATGSVQREYITQRPERGEEFEMPEGHIIKGVSALTDGTGRVLAQWIKTREGADPLSLVEQIKQAFENWEPAAPVSLVPQLDFSECLNLFPLPDLHIGMSAWGREVGEDWDLRIAERVIGDAMAELMSRMPAAEIGVVLGGGDQMHADNNENRTARHGHILQVDGRYPKVLDVTCRLFVRQIDLTLTKHRQVEVRVLQGNHDEHSAIAIAYFLLAWYRNEPRVVVDVDPSLYWWKRYGRNLLGATHGHMAKPAEMPAIMAHRRAEDWGQTKHRYIHMFHVHHHSKIATEGGGVIVETHQTPTPQDAWNFGSGFISGRCLSGITYDKEHGEKGRSKVTL